VTTLVAQGQDLVTVRFAWSPIWETLHAVRTFIDPHARPYHQAWRAAVEHEAARLDLSPLFAVNPLRGSVPDFLTPPPRVPAPSFGDQLAEFRATPPEQVATELERCRSSLTKRDRVRALDQLLAHPAAARDLLADRVQAAWDRLVSPYWPRIRSLAEADIAYRSQQLTGRGLGPMLEDIDPRITWGDGTVVVKDGEDTSVELGGRGLVLMPSAFMWPAVAVIIDEPWQPTIAYPARGIAELWQQAKPPPDALARLMGPTRALVLTSLDQPASATTLAALLKLSLSGASGHLVAMRDAGLVAGRRHGHEIRYARTQLGTALVRASQSRQAQPSRPAGKG
jgi:DNA-binding transcriptional ArsR family regulator